MTKYILTENEIKRIVKETIQEYIEKFRKEVFDLYKITPEMAERTEEKEVNKKNIIIILIQQVRLIPINLVLI